MYVVFNNSVFTQIRAYCCIFTFIVDGCEDRIIRLFDFKNKMFQYAHLLGMCGIDVAHTQISCLISTLSE